MSNLIDLWVKKTLKKSTKKSKKKGANAPFFIIRVSS
jgi:hypothetical protein